MESAGIRHAALCEWDPHACATLRAAGLGPVVEGDVRDLDAIESVLGITEEQAWNRAGDMLLDDPREGDGWIMAREALATELLTPDLDLLWSSFPCQAFSTAGRRKGASDERNGWPWTVDAIDRFRPRWFLGENVRGLLCHSSDGHPDPMRCPRCYFDRVILAQLRERFAHAGYWLLDAADYGVPQHRRRVILWAGPAPLASPAPTHADPATLAQGGLFGPRLLPWVSMAKALDICEDNPPHLPGSRRYYRGRPAPTLCSRDHYGITLRKSVMGEIIEGRRPAHNPRQSVNDVLFMMTSRRRLTIAECARLQDFPPDHPFQGTTPAQYRQVGNAVPPTLARVVAEAVIAADRGE